MRNRLIAALLLVFALTASKASAAPITFDFTASVNSMTGAAFPGLSISDIITGNFTFDDTWSDVNSDPTQGYYVGGGGMTMVIAGSTVISSYLELQILNNAGGAVQDAFNVFSFPFTGGPSGVTVTLAQLLLQTSSTTVVSSDALPTTPFDPTLFAVRALEIDISKAEGQTGHITASPTSMTLRTTAVPEPSSVLLLGMGLFVMFAFRRPAMDAARKGG